MKKFTALLLAGLMVIMMCACSSKHTYALQISGIDEFEMVEIPEGLVNFSNSTTEIDATVKDNGTYNFVIADSDGNEYTITLVYEDNKASVSADDGINVTVVAD